MIHAIATHAHYAAHIDPVWAAIPAELRGKYFGPEVRYAPPPAIAGLTIVAGMLDRHRARGPVALMEHGAGQSYPGDPASAGHSSYAGGSGWDHAAVIVCPGPASARLWSDSYPSTPVHAVGSPVLDRWHGYRPPLNVRPVVAFTWHWDCDLVAETGSAWGEYRPAMPSIVEQLGAQGFDVVGHAHPRWAGAHAHRWEAWGCRYVDDWSEVMATADMVVADNTSAMYEFAATDRPVVALNSRRWRRDVDHGLRFWSAVPGLQVDRPTDVVATVRAAWLDPLPLKAMRRAAVAEAYAAVDGRAAERAAAAIVAAARLAS